MKTVVLILLFSQANLLASTIDSHCQKKISAAVMLKLKGILELKNEERLTKKHKGSSIYIEMGSHEMRFKFYDTDCKLKDVKRAVEAIRIYEAKSKCENLPEIATVDLSNFHGCRYHSEPLGEEAVTFARYFKKQQKKAWIKEVNQLSKSLNKPVYKYCVEAVKHLQEAVNELIAIDNKCENKRRALNPKD